MQITTDSRAQALAHAGSTRVVVADRRDHAFWRAAITDFETRAGGDIKLVAPDRARSARLNISSAVAIVDGIAGTIDFGVDRPQRLVDLPIRLGPQTHLRATPPARRPPPGSLTYSLWPRGTSFCTIPRPPS
jgi:hypothetical protein